MALFPLNAAIERRYRKLTNLFLIAKSSKTLATMPTVLEVTWNPLFNVSYPLLLPIIEWDLR